MDIEEAIERLKYINMAYDYNNYYSRYDLDCIETALNLIQTQQAELEKKDRIINEMAKTINKEYYKDIIENYTKKVDCKYIYKKIRLGN